MSLEGDTFEAWVEEAKAHYRAAHADVSTSTIVMSRGGGTLQGTTSFAFDSSGRLSSARIEIKGKVAGTRNEPSPLADVSRHEFGHVVGLEHWNIPRQLLSPYVTPALGSLTVKSRRCRRCKDSG